MVAPDRKPDPYAAAFLRSDQLKRHAHFEDLSDRDFNAFCAGVAIVRRITCELVPLIAIAQYPLQQVLSLGIDRQAIRIDWRIAALTVAAHLEVHDQLIRAVGHSLVKVEASRH